MASPETNHEPEEVYGDFGLKVSPTAIMDTYCDGGPASGRTDRLTRNEKIVSENSGTSYKRGPLASGRSIKTARPGPRSRASLLS